MTPASLSIESHAEPSRSSFQLWLRRIAALDVRALATLRIGMGVILIWDLVTRAPDIAAHYTDEGVLPRAARKLMKYDFNEAWWTSLHMLSGSYAWQVCLFCVAGIAALALLIGYRTKPALLVSAFLLLSLHGRFPLLLQGGDVLLRCMLFWAFFLPLDRCWSFSQPGSAGAPHRGSVACVASFAFIVQLSVMYVASAFLKTSPAWRTEFSATYYALGIDHFTGALGYRLMDYPVLLQWLTGATMLLESVGPLLLLTPIGLTWVRTLVPLAFILFHGTLVLTMDIGTFPWICILAWTVLLPSPFWDGVERIGSRLLGQRSPRRPGLAIRPFGSLTTNGIAAFFLIYVLLMNVYRLGERTARVGQAPLAYLGQVLGIEQYWNMFAPQPAQFGSWFRMEGELADGSLVNLYQPDQPLPDTKPANISASYPSQYWRRCLVTMFEFFDPAHQDGVLSYYSRHWNQSHDETHQVRRARLVLMITPTPPPGSDRHQAVVAQRHQVRELDVLLQENQLAQGPGY